MPWWLQWLRWLKSLVPFAALAPAPAKQSPPVLGFEDSDLQDQTFSTVTTTPQFVEPRNSSLRRTAPENMSQSVGELWVICILRGDCVPGCYVLFLNYSAYLVE